MKIIHCSHWQEAPDGWTVYTEQEQDITKSLNHDDNSIDAIFSEHGLEHIKFINALLYAKECFRVLKPDGVLRVCMPCIDKLIKFKNDDLGKHFSDVQLLHYFIEEDKALKELGLNGIKEDSLPFLMDSLLKGHNHKHVWSSQLFKKVLEKIGFSKVYIVEPGHTHFDHDDCLERVIRGVDAEHLKSEFKLDYYDPESKVIEAKK